MLSTFKIAWILGLISLPGLLFTSSAQEKNTSTTSEKNATQQESVRAYIDPKTGQLIEKPAVKNTTPSSTPKTTAEPEPKVIYLPDGSKMIDLQDSQQIELKVSQHDDGTLTTKCENATHKHEHLPASKPDKRTTSKPKTH
jgi:hypothetical protein